MALASSEAVLTPDEKDLGVMLLDVGGGTTVGGTGVGFIGGSCC